MTLVVSDVGGVSVGGVGAGELAVDPSVMATDRIELQLRVFAAASAAAMCRLLLLVAEYDRRGGFEAWECSSCARWLELHCHVSAKTAREWVRVARALLELPLTCDAFSRGELTYSKVRVLTRVATAASEEDLVELARAMPATQFERAVRAIERSLVAMSAEDERRVEALRCADRHDNGDGTITWTLRVDVEEDELISAAIAHARDDAFASSWGEGGGERGDGSRPGNGAGSGTADAVAGAAEAPRRGGLPRLDALLRALELGLPADADGLVPSRYVTVVHVESGSALDEDGFVRLASGLRLHPSLAARLGCDSTVQVVEHLDDGGVRLGRRARTFTAKQRELIAERFATCGFPGCDVPARRCQFHHLTHWSSGGLTDVDNGLPLCRRHHRSVHAGGWRLWRNAGDEIIAVGPDGRRLMRKIDLPVLDRPAHTELLSLIDAMGVQVAALDQPERCGRAVVDDVVFTVLANHANGNFPLRVDDRQPT